MTSIEPAHDGRWSVNSLTRAQSKVAARLTRTTPHLDLVADRDWIETDHFWVIFYNERSFYESDAMSELAGNAPFLVPKSASGEISRLNTVQTVEEQLDQLGEAVLAESPEHGPDPV
jgi:hypothetical protein